MPANKKYLTTSSWQKFAKISAGLLGGYAIAALLHMCLPLFLPYPKEVLVTSIFTLYLVWVTLMLIPYLYENGWKVWLVYMAIIIVLYMIYSFGNQTNPFI